MLFVLCRGDHVAHLLSCDGDTASLQLSQQSDDTVIECADVDDNTVENDHVNRPEYAANFKDLLQQICSQTGRMYPVVQYCYLPLVYLPVFSPPKITA